MQKIVFKYHLKVGADIFKIILFITFINIVIFLKKNIADTQDDLVVLLSSFCWLHSILREFF